MSGTVHRQDVPTIAIGKGIAWVAGAVFVAVLAAAVDGQVAAEFAGSAILLLSVLFNPVRRSFGPIRRGWLLALLLAFYLQRLFIEGVSVPPSMPLLVAVVLAVPIAEELVFRGWLWEEIEAIWPAWATMLTTALLCAASHVMVVNGGLQWVAVIVGTGLLTLARRYCGSAWASLILHVTINAGVVLTRGL